MEDVFHSSMEEYWSLREHDLKLEYINGCIVTMDHRHVVLLGGTVENTPDRKKLIMIDNASKEEIEKVAEVINEMRKKNERN